MDCERFRFSGFDLDPANRSLRLEGEPVEVSGRYFDALELLVREQGRLVTKDRFMAEVWRGVPVTDEALTQCIRSLRRQLGDDAANPRFIETVPKHGYRFVAPVRSVSPDRRGPPPGARWRRSAILAASGTLGGAVAGLAGGLFYGFALTGEGVGSASTVLVMLCAALLVALAGAAGVSAGIAAAARAEGRIGPWSVLGGAGGGLIVGALVKIVGIDAAILLLGLSPGDITGAPEGAVLGGAVGLAVWAATRVGQLSLRIAAAAGAIAGALAGSAIALAGGRLLAGSLELVSATIPFSRLRLEPIGAMFGESGFGAFSNIAMSALEGALFAACVAAAMTLAEKRFARPA